MKKMSVEEAMQPANVTFDLGKCTVEELEFLQKLFYRYGYVNYPSHKCNGLASTL